MSVKLDKKIEADYLRKRIGEKKVSAGETREKANLPKNRKKTETSATYKTFKEYAQALGYDYPDSVAKAKSPLAEFQKINENKLKENGINSKQLVQKFRADKGVIEEKSEPKVAQEEPEAKVIPVTPKDEKNVVTPREQKKYLLGKNR